MTKTQRTCLSCGSSLSEGERFCGSCGQPSHALPGNAAAAGGSRKWLAVVLGVAALLLLAITAYVIWAYANIKSPTPNSPPASGPASAGKPPAATTNPSPATVRLEDFAGNWHLVGESGSIENSFILKLNSGRIQGAVGNNQDRKIDLGPAGQNQLKGTYTVPGQNPMPMTAELSADKQKLILTLAPPQSEYIVTVAMRSGAAVESGGSNARVNPSPRVSKITAGLGLDQNQGIINPTNVFKTDTPEIFISVEVDKVSKETAVDITWVYLGTNDSIKAPTQSIKSDARAGFSLTRPTRGWPVGQYRSTVYLNGVEAGNISFSVK